CSTGDPGGQMKLLHPAPVGASQILAIGAKRGERVVPNSEIVEPINSSDEWIRQRTGIATRVYTDDSVLDLAMAAAEDALTKAGMSGADIDVVLVSTVTHFEQTPALAAMLADQLGATPAPAFDISAACAGYCYGIAQADALVRAGTARHVL